MDLSNLLGGNKAQTPAEPVAAPVEPVVPTVDPVVPPPPLPVTEPVVPEPVMPPVMPSVPEATPPVSPPVPPPVPTPVAPVTEPVATSVPEIPEAPVVEAPVVEAPVATTAATTSPQIPGEVFEGVGSGKYKVVVIKDKCIGAASCVAVSPKTFELNDQQIAKVLPTVKTETDENLLLAAQSCPTLAIEVYDTATGEKVWPK
jgi:ferredoxin